MGEVISSLKNVGYPFDNYLFVITHDYSTTANDVIKENWENFSLDIGKNNVIARPKKEGLIEAIEIFEINIDDKRPILILTQFHPLKDQDTESPKERKIIQIPLGSIKEKDTIVQTMFEIIEYIKSEDYKKIEWITKKLKFDSFLKKLEIVATLKSIFL